MGFTFNDAQHLLARTGFGGTPTEIQALTALDRKAAVEQVLATTRTAPVTTPPPWIDDLPPHPRKRKSMSSDEKKCFGVIDASRAKPSQAGGFRKWSAPPRR